MNKEKLGMKTVKFFVLIFLAALLLQVATSCQNEPVNSHGGGFLANNNLLPQVSQPDKYSVLLYQNATASEGDTVTPKYTGKDFYAQKNYSKSNATIKQTNVSGNQINLSYNKSVKLNLYKDDIDIYETSYENRLLRVEYNAVTGKVARYIRYAPCTNREYISEVSPQSSEEDYIGYVEKILSELAGISVDGREVKVSTKIIKENEPPQYESRFVNDSDTDSNFHAEYTFEFYSTIDGIKRTDDVRITVTNVGEICSLTALVNDEAYQPFQNVQINQALINAEVDKAFSNVRSLYDVKSYNISLRCLPIESKLWVEATVEFSYQVEEYLLTSGVKYLIKVAEIK